MGLPALVLLAKLAQQGLAVGGKAYAHYSIANRLLGLPTTEAAVRDLEQAAQAMSDAERIGFTVVLTALARNERQPERRERYTALLRTLPLGEAALKVNGVAARPQPPQPNRPPSVAPAAQGFKVNKFEKYTHRGYDFTFPDIRRPVISIWEAGSADIARMRRIDLADGPVGRWVALRDWQNSEVQARARRDGADIWLLKL